MGSTTHPHRAALAATALALTTLVGCAGPAEETDQAATTSPQASESSPAPSSTSTGPSTPSSAPSTAIPTPEAPRGPTLRIGIDGDDVTPNAVEFDLAVGEPLTISFATDRGGELHVHSKPEQYVEFEAGRSTQELVIQTPGLVEIEEHDTEAVVAVVQVR